MGETQNIADMAKHVAEQLFATFHWKMIGPQDESWPCVDANGHKPMLKSPALDQSGDVGKSEDPLPIEASNKGKAVEAGPTGNHPTDAVFYYDEPYSRSRTYLNTDLKSYAAKSIGRKAVKDAIESLAKAITCAEKSEVWRTRYVHEDVQANIVGLLFVYNHDGDYNARFDELLETIKPNSLKIPRGSKIVVMGPKDIRWLDNVHSDLLKLSGGKKMGELTRFYYPNLVQFKNVLADTESAATVEMLQGPWITIKHRKNLEDKEDVLVYYRGSGASVEEFSDLIDYMMSYQIVNAGVKIAVRALAPDKESSARFQRAIDLYAIRFKGGKEMIAQLRAISYESMTHTDRYFSSVEIGMIRGRDR